MDCGLHMMSMKMLRNNPGINCDRGPMTLSPQCACVGIWDYGGGFAQRGHSANYHIVQPGNAPEHHPPTEACMIDSTQHRGGRIQDPGICGKHQTKIRLKQKIPGVPAGAGGCRIQDPGTHGYRWWKTADFSHSTGTAHGAPPMASHSSFQVCTTENS